jgi:hypothetical protein
MIHLFWSWNFDPLYLLVLAVLLYSQTNRNCVQRYIVLTKEQDNGTGNSEVV